MNNIKIVVGCNTDLEFLDEALKNPNLIVFAFEPNSKITENIKNLPNNYILINKAVSLVDGIHDFYIHSDTWSSSLNNWGDGPRWGTLQKTEVISIRLDTFLKEKNIKSIDYIHIDAQGGDLDVLKSLGNYIQKVSEGVCESLAPKTSFKLYKNQASFEEIKKFLISNGFEFYWEHNLIGQLKLDEINIYFKKSNNPREIKKLI